LPLSQSATVTEVTRTLYQRLLDFHVEVLWDDRDERAGVKFNDADLIGAPFQLVVGEKGLAKGTVELKNRRTGSVTQIAPDDVPQQIVNVLRQERAL
jgi:prolyl-tRNA synthetase